MIGHCHWYWHRRLGVTDNDRSLSVILIQEAECCWQWPVTVIDTDTGDWELLTMTGHCHWYWHTRLGITEKDRPAKFTRPVVTVATVGLCQQRLHSAPDRGTKPTPVRSCRTGPTAGIHCSRNRLIRQERWGLIPNAAGRGVVLYWYLSAIR
jgi:hypothetical protein